MEETGQAAEEMNEGLDQGSGRMGKLSGAAAKLGPILGALAAAAAVVGPAIAKGLDAGAATAKMRAQLGVTAKESERLGGVAGKLYSSAYGESMDEVRTAITKVVQNMDGMRTASSGALKDTAAQALTVATVMEEDVGRVTMAVSQLMRNGLAKNSKQAFDLLTKATAAGVNNSKDLLDTVNEYSTQFREVGIDGPKALGLLSQALRAGARDSDTAADAIKEFAIRSKTAADPNTIAGFKALGLNVREMTRTFAAGGPAADKAFKLVIDRLKNIEDPVKRNTAAVALFGTKAEDLGDSLFALDPTTAVKSLGDLKGATDAASKAMGGTLKARLTSFKRTLETQVTNAASRALNGLAKLGGEVRKGFRMPAAGKAANDWQRMGQELRKVATWVQTRLVPALRDLGEFLQKRIIPTAVKFYREVLGELGKQIKRVAGELSKSGVPWGKILGAMKAIYAFAQKYLLKLWSLEFRLALKIVGTWIVYCIKVFKLLWGEANRVWRTFQRGVTIIKDWYKNNKRAIDGFRNAALTTFQTVLRVFLGFASNLVRGAAKAFGWVPGLGGKLRKAEREIRDFARGADKWINGIKAKKRIAVTVDAKGHWRVPGGGTPKTTAGLARGGPVPALAPGATEAYDSQPALLRVNEHVWTPEEVRASGGHGAMLRMRAAARKGLLQGFAGGGPVGVGISAKVPSAGAFDKQVVSPINAGYAAMIRHITEMLAKIIKRMLGAGSVVGAARSMIGYPYSWGGGGKGGPSYGIGRGAGTFGFDCSGLTEYAWWKGARKSIGGVTDTQWAASSPSARRPGALGFPSGPSVHVVLASDRPGHIIQAPYTGSHVQEISSGRGYAWRWPKSAGYYSGGPVGQFGKAALHGPGGMVRMAQALGILGDPRRARAGGGPVSANEPYLVGEHGPEVMVPRAIGTVHSAGTKVVNVTQNITLRVEATPGTNRAALGREINDLLVEYKRRGGKLATNRPGA